MPFDGLHLAIEAMFDAEQEKICAKNKSLIDILPAKKLAHGT
jgi:hypothetical protein